jgi:hypothetical protein
MPALVLLLTLLVVFLLIVLPIWSLIRAKTAQDHAWRLQTEVQELQRQVARTPPAPRPPLAAAPLIKWELFTGVKLAAWIGGLALFLAVAFFVSAKVGEAMSVCLGFGALFTGAAGLARRRGQEAFTLGAAAPAAGAGLGAWFKGRGRLVFLWGVLGGVVVVLVVIVAHLLPKPERHA